MNRAPPAKYCAKFVFLRTMRVDGHKLPMSLALLHSLMWKFQVQDFVPKESSM